MLSQLFSVVGTLMVQFVLLLYILDFTQSSIYYGGVSAVISLGRLLGLPFSEIIVDRSLKRKLMIVLDSSYLLITFVLILMLNKLSLIPMIILLLILGLISSVETPLVQSSLPIVSEGKGLLKVNSYVTAIGYLGMLVAPGLGSTFYNYVSVKGSLILCCVLFVLAIISEYQLELPEHIQEIKTQSWKETVYNDWKLTWEYIRDKQIIIKICLLAAGLNLFIGAFIQTLIPYIARVHLNVDNFNFGILSMNLGISSLLGTLLYSLIVDKLKSKNFWIFFVGISLSIAAIGFTLISFLGEKLSFYLLNGFTCICLILFAIISMHLLGYIQLNTKVHMIGKVMSFVFFVSSCMNPLGQIFYGYLGDQLNQSLLVIVIIALGVITIIAGVVQKSIFGSLDGHND